MLKKNFDTYVAYYKPARVADSYGQVRETWSLHQKSMVHLETYSGDEDIQSERLVSTNITHLVGHFLTGVDTTYRILMDSVWYEILDIEPLERKRWMRLRIEKIND
jgi:head-tail adaptor